MAFIQPCFIRKNTPELRKKLEELGYKRYPLWMADWSDDDSRYVYLVADVLYYTYPQVPTKPKTGEYIDCGDNEELFIALAALRNDTNENQWFIAQRTMWDENYNGEITVYYEENEWLMWGYYSLMEEMSSDFRKATVEEIIEHFKKE